MITPNHKKCRTDINGLDPHKMRPHGGLKEEEANDAAWEAGRGAMVGAARVLFLPLPSCI